MTVAVLPSRTETLPNERTPEFHLHSLTDPSMTREARTQRAAWRLDHLDLWQAQIEMLNHYQPWYPYDIAHEYEYDWTTDPDYCAEGIALFEFDENGTVRNEDERSRFIETHMRDTARDRVGRRVVYQTGYLFVPEIAVRLGRYTAQGKPANAVKPDLMVMPSEEDLYVDKSLPPEERGPRPDDPVPELVLEILSESTAQKDLNEKRLIYETLGGSSSSLRSVLMRYDRHQSREPGLRPDSHRLSAIGGCQRQNPILQSSPPISATHGSAHRGPHGLTGPPRRSAFCWTRSRANRDRPDISTSHTVRQGLPEQRWAWRSVRR